MSVSSTTSNTQRESWYFLKYPKLEGAVTYFYYLIVVVNDDYIPGKNQTREEI